MSAWKLLLVLVILIILPSPTRAATIPVTGWAWTSYLGWIHFNGAGYGVYKDTNNGNLSGYAWSPFLGWITFNSADVSPGCPSGTCSPKVTPGNGRLEGWARACGAFSNKDSCSEPLDSGSGGWDGWIHLSSGSLYAVTSTNGCWSGYAWGSKNIGYIKFAGINNRELYGVGDSTCGSITGTCSVTPASAFANENFTWSVSGLQGGNGSYSYSWSGTDGLTGSSATVNKSYTTNGTKNASVIVTSGSISTPLTCQSAVVNPCYGQGCTPPPCLNPPCTGCSYSGPAQPKVSVPSQCCSTSGSVCPIQPTANLSANPSTIDRGQSSKLYWSSTDATSCTAAGGFSTGGAISNSTGTTVTPSQTSTYQITCSGPGGTSQPSNATITVLVPGVNISADPMRVPRGDDSVVSWTSTQVTSCSITGPGLSTTGLTGSRTVPISTQSTFTATCQTNGSPVSDSVTVNIRPGFSEF